jgi:predicted dehydrogenase
MTDSSLGTPLRMAVVGCGPIGELHARAIAGSASAVLAAVCDTDRVRAAAVSQRFGGQIHTDLREMLAYLKLDAIMIATPDHLHLDPALAAIAAGAHVFCEKPLASSFAEAERISAAAAARGVFLAVDYNRRFGFGYQAARRWCEEGAIGDLQSIVVRVCDRTPPPRVARVPHVMFTTLLTHHFDLVRWFGGEPRQLQAHAAAMAGDELIRTATVTLAMSTGALATIVADYRDDQSRTSEWMELSGTRGSITVEDVTRRATLIGVHADHRHVAEPNPFLGGDTFYQTVVDHVHAFVEAVAAGQAPPATGFDGLMGMRLAEAAIESLRLNSAVEIPS